jgi:hypothetical protein
MKRRDPIALWSRLTMISKADCARGMHGPFSFGCTPGNIRCAQCGKVLRYAKVSTVETLPTLRPDGDA